MSELERADLARWELEIVESTLATRGIRALLGDEPVPRAQVAHVLARLAEAVPAALAAYLEMLDELAADPAGSDLDLWVSVLLIAERTLRIPVPEELVEYAVARARAEGRLPRGMPGGRGSPLARLERALGL